MRGPGSSEAGAPVARTLVAAPDPPDAPQLDAPVPGNQTLHLEWSAPNGNGAPVTGLHDLPRLDER